MALINQKILFTENFTHLKNRHSSLIRASDRYRSDIQSKKALHQTKASISDSSHSSSIDELLSNANLSNEEIAEKLSQTALNPMALEADRLEAFSHCENMGFSYLMPLSGDPNLPFSLAEEFINGLYRHDNIKEQVSGALALLNHYDAEICDQAQSLLVSLLGKEEESQSPENLRAAAYAFLQQFDEIDQELEAGYEDR